MGYNADFYETDVLPTTLRGHLVVLAFRDSPCVVEVAGFAAGREHG